MIMAKEHVIINFINFIAKIEVENLYLHNPRECKLICALD